MYVIIVWLSVATTSLIIFNGAVIGSLAIKFQHKGIIIFVNYRSFILLIFASYISTWNPTGYQSGHELFKIRKIWFQRNCLSNNHFFSFIVLHQPGLGLDVRAVDRNVLLRSLRSSRVRAPKKSQVLSEILLKRVSWTSCFTIHKV